MPDVSGYGSMSPQPDPADKVRRSRRAKIAVGVLVAIAAVAFGAGWNPPTKTTHQFTEASDYNSDRESGCTNSGKGCHGDEDSYKDFNAYHPNAECTTCHDYQGVACIPCHMPPEVECQLCHDGTFEPAPDRVRLSDPYPKGHYRESTHTAMGTDFAAEVRAAEEGEAKLPCESCHSRGLAKAHTEVPAILGSEYGESVGCGECHNDVRSFGQAEVLTNWKKRTCEGCHKKKSSSPMHDAKVADPVKGTGELGCGETGQGCHADNDLHALHADAPKNCSGSAETSGSVCHVIGTEALNPTATTCGGTEDKTCHVDYQNTEYSHKKDATLHAPKTSVPARDVSYYDTACGGCHRMGADGTSLVDEHAIATSAKSDVPSDNCANCHNSDASVLTVKDSWVERDTTGSCSACHGNEGLAAAHEGDLTAPHVAENSAGCAETGAGCHPTADLLGVGTPTTTANLHRDCLRCHDWTESDGNLAYNTQDKSCGSGRACHGTAGAYSPETAVHSGTGGRTDGSDSAHHAAGAKQASARYVDQLSGVSTGCTTCHSMVLGDEHGRPTAALATGEGTLCVRCHNRSAATSGVVKGSWSAKNSEKACESCHGTPGISAVHAGIDSGHVGVEISPGGDLQPGACTSLGCHGTTDLRVLHADKGCAFSSCHDRGGAGGLGLKSCGGIDAGTSCHVGYSAGLHFVEHSGELQGSVNGVSYVNGQNVGCFGCHLRDLVDEHENARLAGTLEGGGANSCAICHESVGGGVSGTYASLPAVKAAIANHDRRCSACHASGSHTDGPTSVASAHKNSSTATTLPPGAVWADPITEWKAAFDSPTGGGHNVLSSALVGGAVSKRFPMTQFEIGGAEYTWALPSNSGPTQWLKPEAFGAPSLDSTSAIQHIDVKCSDCHNMAQNPAGPQGAAVRISIDPAYSQTEYANPTDGYSQFKATGTKRVVCAKCHSVFSGSVAGTTAPGGSALHARHVEHLAFNPATNPRYYGEKCIDCHVRIPHAWKRPRLLIRTIVTTDGAQGDVFPYVAKSHDGLLGVQLRSFIEPSDLRSGSCVTGGCHANSSANRHPRPSDVPTATYWP